MDKKFCVGIKYPGLLNYYCIDLMYLSTSQMITKRVASVLNIFLGRPVEFVPRSTTLKLDVVTYPIGWSNKSGTQQAISKR